MYNTFHKEESLVVIGLKMNDPMIDKAVKEVEQNRKTDTSIKKTKGNVS